MTPDAIHAHAAALLGGELTRRRGVLERLPHYGGAVVQALADQTVAAVVETLLDQAASDPLVADALDAVYGDRQRNGVGTSVTSASG